MNQFNAFLVNSNFKWHVNDLTDYCFCNNILLTVNFSAGVYLVCWLLTPAMYEHKETVIFNARYCFQSHNTGFEQHLSTPNQHFQNYAIPRSRVKFQFMSYYIAERKFTVLFSQFNIQIIYCPLGNMQFISRIM
jgi:hypothetical protein